MARIKSDNYDAKRGFIMDKAARLFADSGYPNTRMMDIALACNSSKSMLYHYFPKKEDILYAMLEDHLVELIKDIDALTANPGNDGGLSMIRAFVDLFVQKSAKARTRHLVAMLDVKYLPKKQQTNIKNLEKEIVALTSAMLRVVNPGLPDHEYNPYALLLIGTINSMDTWRKPNGLYSAAEMGTLVANLFLNGFLNAKASAL